MGKAIEKASVMYAEACHQARANPGLQVRLEPHPEAVLLVRYNPDTNRITQVIRRNSTVRKVTRQVAIQTLESYYMLYNDIDALIHNLVVEHKELNRSQVSLFEGLWNFGQYMGVNQRGVMGLLQDMDRAQVACELASVIKKCVNQAISGVALSDVYQWAQHYGYQVFLKSRQPYADSQTGYKGKGGRRYNLGAEGAMWWVGASGQWQYKPCGYLHPGRRADGKRWTMHATFEGVTSA
ncbi:hypothetical protein [Pseudomonas virus PBPA162]|uniref:Uncharacterized protein n=1 Tax=Pseudomonas virus PBPA162 TaxID=2588096 RepID=A0A4Y5TNI9_9CAUD|nr:hypothetical protein PQC32_gp62 [Pseudomonas virus PBPA162]QDB70896.1 hypothetical protein [Pseudomonas virus PBPA162]